MKLAIAGDSAGADLASVLVTYLADRFDVTELSNNPESKDEKYANLSDRVCSDVISGKFDRAVLVCGTGIGVCSRLLMLF